MHLLYHRGQESKVKNALKKIGKVIHPIGNSEKSIAKFLAKKRQLNL